MKAVARGVEAGPVMVHHEVLGRRLGTHAGRPPPMRVFRGGAVLLARRPWERHVQAEAQDRGKQCARDRHAADSPSGCSAARAVTPNVRHGGCQTTKYPTKAVLHDFARSDAGFRRR